MRIAFDARPLLPKPTGMGKAFSHLVRTLRRAFPQDCFDWIEPPPLPKLPHHLLWEQWGLPRKAFRGYDLFHATGFPAPLLYGHRTVATVHDLIPLVHPEFFPYRRTRWYWGSWLLFTAKRARAIIVPSASTQRDLLRFAPELEGKITVIRWGLTLDLSKETAWEEVARRYQLNFPYLFYCGALDRRKDYPSLLEALAKLGEHHLVIAGTLIQGRTDFHSRVEQLGLQNRVHFLGYVPEADLVSLYRHADLFVYPSFYEGFGLPLLEAMACGVPVVTYRGSAPEEVVGEAAVLVEPPWSGEKLFEAFVDVLPGGHTSLRKKLIEAGKRRVQRFSWEQIAQTLYELYQRLLAQS